MKFIDFKYERPNFQELEKNLRILLRDFNDSQSFKEENNIFIRINRIRNHVSTMVKLCFIRHSMDIDNEFYKNEQNFLDEKLPNYMELESIFYKSILSSRYREELEKTWGSQLFKLADMQSKTFSKNIIEDLVEENKLVTSYSVLIASAKIDFMGKKRNLSQISAFKEDADRNIRKEAHEAYNLFFEKNQTQLDNIYDRLVKTRDRMAKKLGFENFIELGYLRMGRSDYGQEDVQKYRNQVYRDVVPLSIEINKIRKKNLGIDKIRYYDENVNFLSGNPKPRGDYKFVLENARKMYGEISKETQVFFDFMLNNSLMDLLSRRGKMAGGYCDYLEDYRSPFIFANFNGTRGDIDVLTHEIGHAFQTYMSRDLEILDYSFPTSEAAEIHSMTMEFIAYPWMELFFAEDSNKYRFSHLTSAINFIPYGVLVDEFQHRVYEKPNMSSRDRKEIWRELERKYLPERDYEGSEFLDKGGFWYRQAHIFEAPFYYIDYTLAQVIAFEFFNKLRENRSLAWKDYLRICQLGGSKSFLGILEAGNLENPFIDGNIRKIINPIKTYLKSIS